MAGSAISTPTAQLVNANVQNDGSADSPRGYAISTNADLTMTIANTRVYVTATSANRTVTLPTTSVKAGMVVEVQTACTSPYTIAINSSGANLIDTLKGTKGSIKLMALQDAPTTAAHWRVMEVYDEGVWTPTLTFASTNGTMTHSFAGPQYTRNGRMVHITTYLNITAIGTAAGAMSIGGLPFASTSSGSYQTFPVYCGLGFTDSLDPTSYIGTGSTTIAINRNGMSVLNASEIVGGSDFIISGTYHI